MCGTDADAVTFSRHYILKAQIESGLADVVATGDNDERKEKVDELMQVFARYGHIGER